MRVVTKTSGTGHHGMWTFLDGQMQRPQQYSMSYQRGRVASVRCLLSPPSPLQRTVENKINNKKRHATAEVEQPHRRAHKHRCTPTASVGQSAITTGSRKCSMRSMIGTKLRRRFKNTQRMVGDHQHTARLRKCLDTAASSRHSDSASLRLACPGGV